MKIAYLNDLWKFDGNNWTWIKGNNTRDQRAVYGTLGVPNSANYPGGRSGSTSWKDSQNNMWLFGGQGYANSTYGE